jgi:hypothetical protein
VPIDLSLWQNIVTPLRFFGLSPSRRASFSTSGEGSEEASVAELAGFEAAAVESVPAATVAGAVAEEEVVDEEGLADEVALSVGALEAGALGAGALGAGALGAGDWAPHGAPATSMSDARRAKR